MHACNPVLFINVPVAVYSNVKKNNQALRLNNGALEGERARLEGERARLRLCGTKAAGRAKLTLKT